MSTASGAAVDNEERAPWWRRALSPLHVELHWLDGLTWRLLGLAAAISAVLCIGSVAIAAHNGEYAPMLLNVATTALTGLAIPIIAIALSNLCRPTLPLPAILVVAVLSGALLGRSLYYVLNFGPMAAWTGPPLTEFVRYMLVGPRQRALPWLLVAAAWYFMRRADLRERALRDVELVRGRLDASMLEARLRMLQAQVEPHFLFNTLAHLKRLYRTDPARGRLMLDRLCAYLRSALPQMRRHDSTLGRETDLARAYLDVQHIRMGRRLAIEIAVADRLRAHPFPPTMLISLIENAIKHGLNPLPEGGIIGIEAHTENDALRVTVADTGGGFAKSRGTGVGLANIRVRLAAIYGPSARVTLAANLPRGVAATIQIPFLPHALVAVDGAGETGAIAAPRAAVVGPPLEEGPRTIQRHNPG
ncbi:MAG: histidine kinase [Casimicrobiaceae bacterium]